MARPEPPAGDPTAPGGVQSVRRCAALLRALTSTPATGARLTDLAAALALDRTTVHRLLQTLADERLVEQDPSSKRYHLGLDFFALAAAASRPGILHSQDEYGLGAANAAEAALAKAGVQVVAKEAFAARDNDFSAQLLSLKSKDADVIVAFTYNRDGALILSQRKSLGIDLPYVALIGPDDLTGVIAVADAVLGSAVGPASEDFVKRYTKRFTFAPDPYGAAYYDGAMILADGLRKVGPDRAKLRDSFAGLKDYKGISRTFSTDAENNMAHSLALVRFKPGTKEMEPVASFPRQAG